MGRDNLGKFLGFLDASGHLCEQLRVLSFDQEKAFAFAGDMQDRQAALHRYMYMSFRYLSLKFRSFWFPDVRHEHIMRKHRPDIEPFSPLDFEQLVRTVLYLVEEREFKLTKGSYDEGIDLWHEEPLYAGGPDPVGCATSIVQCKLYRGCVPVSDVRQFFGVMVNKVAGGYFLTTGQLTEQGGRIHSRITPSGGGRLPALLRGGRAVAEASGVVRGHCRSARGVAGSL